MDKNFLTILIISLIAVAVWIGFSVYSVDTQVDVNPNATSYTNAIKDSFNADLLDQLEARIEENLLVKPDVFRKYEIE